MVHTKDSYKKWFGNCILFKIRKLIYAFAVFWTADVYSMAVKLNIN